MWSENGDHARLRLSFGPVPVTLLWNRCLPEPTSHLHERPGEPTRGRPPGLLASQPPGLLAPLPVPAAAPMLLEQLALTEPTARLGSLWNPCLHDGHRGYRKLERKGSGS